MVCEQVIKADKG